MGLYERLCGNEEPKLPVHQFMSVLGEIERAKMDEADADALFGLSAGEEAELATLVTKIKTPLEGYSLAGRVTLTNVGSTYDANIDAQSLPFIYIQRAGVTRIDMELRVRKVGTGTQHWQLWDETNATSALDSDASGGNNLTTGDLSDEGAAADRTLSGSRTFGQALSPQVVKLRLRCRSTVSADDPVFLGGALLLFRVDRMTSQELHEVLLIGEAGYLTVAEVKSRLGVS